MIELIEKTKDKVVVKLKPTNLNRLNANEFKKELIPVFDKYNDVIIDFSNIKTIDCFAYGKILFLKEELKQRNGKLKIINAKSEYLRKFFSLLKSDLEIVF